MIRLIRRLGGSYGWPGIAGVLGTTGLVILCLPGILVSFFSPVAEAAITDMLHSTAVPVTPKSEHLGSTSLFREMSTWFSQSQTRKDLNWRVPSESVLKSNTDKSPHLIISDGGAGCDRLSSYYYLAENYCNPFQKLWLLVPKNTSSVTLDIIDACHNGWDIKTTSNFSNLHEGMVVFLVDGSSGLDFFENYGYMMLKPNENPPYSDDYSDFLNNPGVVWGFSTFYPYFNMAGPRQLDSRGTYEPQARHCDWLVNNRQNAANITDSGSRLDTTSNGYHKSHSRNKVKQSYTISLAGTKPISTTYIDGQEYNRYGLLAAVAHIKDTNNKYTSSATKSQIEDLIIFSDNGDASISGKKVIQNSYGNLFRIGTSTANSYVTFLGGATNQIGLSGSVYRSYDPYVFDNIGVDSNGQGFAREECPHYNCGSVFNKWGVAFDVTVPLDYDFAVESPEIAIFDFDMAWLVSNGRGGYRINNPADAPGAKLEIYSRLASDPGNVKSSWQKVTAYNDAHWDAGFMTAKTYDSSAAFRVTENGGTFTFVRQPGGRCLNNCWASLAFKPGHGDKYFQPGRVYRFFFYKLHEKDFIQIRLPFGHQYNPPAAEPRFETRLTANCDLEILKLYWNDDSVDSSTDYRVELQRATLVPQTPPLPSLNDWTNPVSVAFQKQKAVGHNSQIYLKFDDLKQLNLQQNVEHRLTLNGIYDSNGSKTDVNGDKYRDFPKSKIYNGTVFLYKQQVSGGTTVHQFSLNGGTTWQNCNPPPPPPPPCPPPQICKCDISHVFVKNILGNHNIEDLSGRTFNVPILTTGTRVTAKPSLPPNIGPITVTSNPSRPSGYNTTYVQIHSNTFEGSDASSWLVHGGNIASLVAANVGSPGFTLINPDADFSLNSVTSGGFDYDFDDHRRDSTYGLSGAAFDIETSLDYDNPWSLRSSGRAWKNVYTMVLTSEAEEIGNTSVTAGPITTTINNQSGASSVISPSQKMAAKNNNGLYGYQWTTDWTLTIDHTTQYNVSYTRWDPYYNEWETKWRTGTYSRLEDHDNDPSTPPIRVYYTYTYAVEWQYEAGYTESSGSEGGQTGSSNVQGEIEHCSFTLMATRPPCRVYRRFFDVTNPKTETQDNSGSLYEIFPIGVSNFYSELRLTNPNRFETQPLNSTGSNAKTNLNTADQALLTSPSQAVIKANGSNTNRAIQKSDPTQAGSDAPTLTAVLGNNPNIPGVGGINYRNFYDTLTTINWPGQYQLTWEVVWKSKARYNWPSSRRITVSSNQQWQGYEAFEQYDCASQIDVYASGKPLFCEIQRINLFEKSDQSPKFKVTIYNPNYTPVWLTQAHWRVQSQAQGVPSIVSQTEVGSGLASPNNFKLIPARTGSGLGQITVIDSKNQAWMIGHYDAAWVLDVERGLEIWRTADVNIGSWASSSLGSRAKSPGQWWDNQAEKITGRNNFTNPNCRVSRSLAAPKILRIPIMKTFFGGIANGGRFSRNETSAYGGCAGSDWLVYPEQSSQSVYGHSGFIGDDLNTIAGTASGLGIFSQSLINSSYSNHQAGHNYRTGAGPVYDLYHLNFANNPADIKETATSYDLGGNFQTSWRCLPNRYHPPKSLLSSPNKGVYYGKIEVSSSSNIVTLSQTGPVVTAAISSGLSFPEYFSGLTDPDCSDSNTTATYTAGTSVNNLNHNDWVCFRARDSANNYTYAKIQVDLIRPSLTLTQSGLSTVVASGSGLTGFEYFQSATDPDCSGSNTTASWTLGQTLAGLTAGDWVCFKAKISSLDLATIADNASLYYRPAVIAGSNNPPTLTVTGGANLNNLKATIYVDGDLLIKDDIKNLDSLSKMTDFDKIGHLTFVVLGDIKIDPSVSQIDAVLVAQAKQTGKISYQGGVINFCYYDLDSLTKVKQIHHWDVCQGQIRVNGALVAQRVLFNRLYASLSDEPGRADLTGTTASEIINLSPTYLISAPIIPFDSTWKNSTGSIFELPTGF